MASEYGSSEGPRSGAQLSSFFRLSLPTLALSKTPKPLLKAWRITVDAGEKENTTIMHYLLRSGKLKDHLRRRGFVDNYLVTQLLQPARDVSC